MIYKTAKRIVIFIIGSTVALIGLIMLVTPGPALIVIPAGLAILATEFAWAAWLLKRLKRQATDMVNSIRGTSCTRAHPTEPSAQFPPALTSRPPQTPKSADRLPDAG